MQRGPEPVQRVTKAITTHISSDGAEWIIIPAELHCPNATICLDPFHIVGWATAALDKVRREVWNSVGRAGLRDEAREIKDSRWALLRNPEDLTEKQSRKLAVIAQVNDPLYRACLLKEQLRMIFRLPYEQAKVLLENWLKWARRCRIEPFVKLARTITYYRQDIEATLLHGVNNARSESANTKIRLIARRAFGFHSAKALIALSELTLGGLCPSLPGRL